MTIPYVRTDDVLLHVEDVSLTLGTRLILRNVDAEIKNITRPDVTVGNVLCFLGPSGMGKTQLCRVIAGLQAASAGVVHLDHDVPVRRGMVGMVPQNYPLFEFATVAQNFAIVGRNAGLTEIQTLAKAAAFVEEFDLGDHLNDFPRQLSGGTRQRVAIVRQLMCDSHVLVLDEPFSGLDPTMKQHACDMITRVSNRAERNVILLVTHDVTEGLSVADTAWLLGREPGLPGARLVEQYDIAAHGFCWNPDIKSDTGFLGFVAEVKARFKTLDAK